MMSVRFRLGLVIFGHFMAMGAWYPVLPNRLEELGFTGTEIGFLYSMLPLGCIFCPFVVSQMADRYFSADRLLAADSDDVDQSFRSHADQIGAKRRRALPV
jgi:MFS family permease